MSNVEGIALDFVAFLQKRNQQLSNENVQLHARLLAAEEERDAAIAERDRAVAEAHDLGNRLTRAIFRLDLYNDDPTVYAPAIQRAVEEIEKRKAAATGDGQ